MTQLELFAASPARRRGPRGFPMCLEAGCRSEGIGPGTPWCVADWTPERDPEGAAIARRLGLLPEERA